MVNQTVYDDQPNSLQRLNKQFTMIKQTIYNGQINNCNDQTNNLQRSTKQFIIVKQTIYNGQTNNLQ